jgi:nucleoside-diphosphate-sugar epimerase
MRILLAGGAGYIGSALAGVLVEHGYQVEVIDLLWFGNHLPAGVKVTQKDLFACREEDLAGCDQIVLLAGLSNDPMAEYSPAENFIYNGALPSYLAFIAKKAGVQRFIYASSCSIYGYTTDHLADEESPVTCGNPYGISKLQGERGVLQLGDESFSVISLRQGTVSGHSPRMRMDLIINTMFKTAMSEGCIRINNPAIWRPVLHIQDATAAMLRAIQAEPATHGIFNVASDNYTVGQAGDLVKSELEKLTGRKIALEIANLRDFRNYKVSFAKAQTELGFRPQYTVPDIVTDLYAHRSEYGDFDHDGYYNIKVHQKLRQGLPSPSLPLP